LGASPDYVPGDADPAWTSIEGAVRVHADRRDAPDADSDHQARMPTDVGAARLVAAAPCCAYHQFEDQE
jgi:hypothetical protein